MFRAIIINVAETCTLAKEGGMKLDTGERKILCKIFGRVCEMVCGESGPTTNWQICVESLM